MIRLGLALFCLASIARAQIEVPDVDAPAEATLVSEHKSVAPGGTLWVAVRITMKPEWHVYWMNPGDSGLAPKVEWKLPKSAAASALYWPAPHRIPTGPLMTYGYDDEVLLMRRLTVPKEWKKETFPIAARASWLVCADVCLEGKFEQRIEVPVRAGAKHERTEWAASFDRARSALPRAAPDGAIEADAEGLRIKTKALPLPKSARAYFFPYDAGWLEHADVQVLTREGAIARLALPRSSAGRKKGKNQAVQGVLVIEDGKARRAFAVDLPIQKAEPREIPK